MVAAIEVEIVEASRSCSVVGIGPVLRFCLLTTNFGSCASYRHYAAGTHYPKYRKTPPISAWEMELVLMTKSVEINSNILSLDLHGSKLSSKLKN
jgi:hypothetical protein